MNEENLFHLALLRPAAERAAFLDDSCGGDASLRRRLDDLLRAHDRAGSFLLESPAGPGEVAGEGRGLLAEGAGSSVGPYRLLEQIGEGGMGTVFRAEQTEPVAREVAVKIIKLGLDTGPVVARFEAERQALAMMDHPNIAKVLDAGSTASGCPYFVMELVKGVPITEYCDAHRLAPRERLELLILVCQAVQHAHQKGIIHRDLKPANVLVARYDGKPVPKVIDFGLAKATEPKLTEHTRFTRLGFVVGTLEYMSPEQAEVNQVDVDTRSDIYSLGVMLYELLTGTTPIEHERLKQISLHEVLRCIREEEPPTPSTRLVTTEGLPSIAGKRGMHPQALRALVRGELDWIVMKALDKDRTRRYEAASALAQDLQRYLDDEPVLACPPSATYRLRKLARKHRVALQAAAAFLVLLIAGVVVSVWQAVEATKARELAREAEGQAVDALSVLADDVVGRQMAKQARLTEEDRRFLGRILGHFERYAAAKGDHVDGRILRAGGAYRVALIRTRLGERQEAVEGFRRAIELFGRLASEFPADPSYRRVMAGAHNNLSIVLSELGQAPEAEAEQRQALDLEIKVAAESPQDPECRLAVARSHLNLAVQLLRRDLWPDAEAELRRVLVIGSELTPSTKSVPELRATLGMAHNSLGNLMSDQGRWQEAEAEQRQAIAIWAELVAKSPTSVDPRRELARSHNGLSTVLQRLERNGDAAAAIREALRIQTRLAADYPASPEEQHQLATSLNNLAVLLNNMGEPGQAEAECRRALGIAERLVAEFSDVPEYMAGLATSHNTLGNVLGDPDKVGDAEAAYRSALDLRQRLVAGFPRVPTYAVERCGSLCNLGNLLLEKRGDHAAALACYQEAISTLEQLLAKEPRNATARRFLCNSYQGSALTLQRLDRDDEAHALIEKVIEYAEGSTRDHYLLVRINVLATTQPVAAMTALEELLSRPQPPAIDPVLLAKICCLASGAVDDADRREQYAARAVALVGQALAKGGFDDPAKLTALRQDPDLAAVRRRPDFRKLFEGGAGTPAGGKRER